MLLAASHFHGGQMRYSLNLQALLIASLISLPSISEVLSTGHTNSKAEPPLAFVPGRLLVKVDPDYSLDILSEIEKNLDAKRARSYSLVKGLYLYQFDPNINIKEAMKLFAGSRAVSYVEPDYIYRAAIIDKVSVNDPDFIRQWALENGGQNDGSQDADINAELMWSHQKGDHDIVIGIIDTGIDYNHPDLIANLWSNPLEIPNNNKDDDQNGYVDDIHGINAIKGNGDPFDDNRHGTHVAGTIGAVGNNNTGVVGVAQSVQISACKFLSSGGSGSISDAIECMDYFAKLKSRANNPLNLVATSNSWGGGGSSQAMLDAIKEHERLGILFIAAAGNEGNNNDIANSFPANYKVSNVISVAATDNKDLMASFSNFGRRSVHIGAPGVKILSTLPGNRYGELSGTSMATPHVSGLVAIIASQYPSLDYVGIKNLILTGGQKISATDEKTISGRRARGADEDGVGSLTCDDQKLVIRNQPTASVYRIPLGQSLFLSAQHVNCATNAGPLVVYQDDNGNITLKDDALDGDLIAQDGIYSYNWTPTIAGEYLLKFSEDDTVSVIVYEHGDFTQYVADDNITYEYVSIQGQRLNAGDDTIHALQSPFPIHFAGDKNGFFDLFISSNGTISFIDQNEPGFHNQTLPTTKANTLVAPYWDDLITTGGSSDIYVEATGTAPNRQLVVEWWRIRNFRTNGLGAFQVVFYENSPDFRFNYLDTDFNSPSYSFGASATIGVQTDQESALLYSFNEPTITSQKSILFTME